MTCLSTVCVHTIYVSPKRSGNSLRQLRHFAQKILNANINLSSPTVKVLSVLWEYFKSCVLCYPQIHSSVATSIWNQFPIDDVESILSYTKAVTMQNLNHREVQQEAIAVAKARCKLVVSHLSVLPASLGLLEELPQNKNTLFVAEIGEDVYKLNQMVNKLTMAGLSTG